MSRDRKPGLVRQYGDTPAANELLKQSFRRVHDKLVKGINVAAIRDHLFQHRVLSTEDYRSLSHSVIHLNPLEQCRQLMAILYDGGHPEAFVQLRLALTEEAAYRWLVDLVDEEYMHIASSDANDSEQENVEGPTSKSGDDRPNPEQTAWPAIEIACFEEEKEEKELVQRMACDSNEPAASSTSHHPKLVRACESDDSASYSCSASSSISSSHSSSSSSSCQPLSAPIPATSAAAAGPASLMAYKRRPLQLTSLRIDGKSTVCGVAELNRHLYIITEGSDTIQIYVSNPTTTTPYVRREAVRLKGLKSPTDLAACVDTGRLYISSGCDHCLWMVDTEKLAVASARKQSLLTSQAWVKTPDYEPWTLSVRSRRVLVTPWTGTRLYVFRTDGKLMRRVNLPAFMMALHAVETSHDTMIVGHVGQGDRVHDQISEVDASGRVLRSFGGERGSGLDQLDEPRHVTLDSDGRVVVADTGNRRVVLLDAELRFEQVLVDCAVYCYDHSQMDTVKPWRLSLVENAAQMIVGYCSKDVDVFRVRPR